MEAEEETDSEDPPTAGPPSYACTEVVQEPWKNLMKFA